MVSEYTPTTDKVLVYIRSRAVMDGASASEAQEAAENWLRSIEREAAARALEEFAEAQDSWCERGRAEKCISRVAMRDALRARAAEIRERKVDADD